MALVDELAASTVNIKVYFWFDSRSYSPIKLRSALMRRVKRALLEAGISMPDQAREVIFPQGLPIYRSDHARSGTRKATEKSKPGKSLHKPEPEPIIANVGEGDLKSDDAELKEKAKTADSPEQSGTLLSDRPR